MGKGKLATHASFKYHTKSSENSDDEKDKEVIFIRSENDENSLSFKGIENESENESEHLEIEEESSSGHEHDDIVESHGSSEDHRFSLVKKTVKESKTV